MFYFISAWYHSERPWYDNTESWYRRGTAMDFDDTINHLRMFWHAKKETTLVVFNYMPNLRYFTHRYDLLEVPTWNAFDRIQDIQLSEHRILDFRDLKWPDGVSFTYTPFMVVARLGHETIAHIEFGDDGQMVWIDAFTEGQMTHKYVFDDRGFLSSILFYQDGQPHHQDYLNTNGEWQVREMLTPSDQSVMVNPHVAHRFARQQYNHMGELVKEQVRNYFAEHDQADDVLFIASDARHNSIAFSGKGRKRVVLSFFRNRFDLTKTNDLIRLMGVSDLVIADTKSLAEELKRLTQEPVEHITPFDTRLTLGKSQRLKELIIYFVVDAFTAQGLEKCYEIFFRLMRENEHVVLSVITYDRDPAMVTAHRQQLEELVAKQDAKDEGVLLADPNQQQGQSENTTDEEEDETPPRVFFDNLRSELEIIDHLDSARVIVDLSPEPDLYTQIAGISAGIPQINAQGSEFVEHLKNGYIITTFTDLEEGLHYYLDGLANWNESLVNSVQKIVAYTSGNLVQNLLTHLDMKTDEKHEK